ncbi:helix-turn-helix domain-containing protein [Gluconacetobacter sp. 1b LMG 1731]|uniref:Helix-turn-helix domain-containing protein n=1 Tax=Gluconacetobacter dulcium TaxID=2729096 RepID=A0A7W4NVQ4_9PROT|nr:helix-turn-helix domain-containing protein [Gluconacetobacter dulcium]MBB2164685.1 helix-turn-helix domain-containing protein [Gluconacetobacter dulcium]MBB2193821.1 helix-turn-helix domain-containing protein [Gluconacetobacter dulcium]
MLTEAEAAERLGVCRAFLQRLRLGKIPPSNNPPGAPPHIRLGNMVKYRPADIDAWLDALSDRTATRRGGWPTEAAQGQAS